MNTRAFFRDKSCAENLLDGREYHAAGIVLQRYNYNNPSLKDLAVSYLNPYTGHIEHAWRSDRDVELYEVSESEWQALKMAYEAIGEALAQ